MALVDWCHRLVAYGAAYKVRRLVAYGAIRMVPRLRVRGVCVCVFVCSWKVDSVSQQVGIVAYHGGVVLTPHT